MPKLALYKEAMAASGLWSSLSSTTRLPIAHLVTVGEKDDLFCLNVPSNGISSRAPGASLKAIVSELAEAVGALRSRNRTRSRSKLVGRRDLRKVPGHTGATVSSLERLQSVPDLAISNQINRSCREFWRLLLKMQHHVASQSTTPWSGATT